VNELRCPTCGTTANAVLAAVGRLPTEVPVGVAAEGLRVVEWHSKPGAKGRPECVAILMDVPALGLPGPLVMRLKTAAVLDELVASLVRHRAGVWPGAPK
jgi:hypothetical protein